MPRLLVPSFPSRPTTIAWVIFNARCLHAVASARIADPRTYFTTEGK